MLGFIVEEWKCRSDTWTPSHTHSLFYPSINLDFEISQWGFLKFLNSFLSCPCCAVRKASPDSLYLPEVCEAKKAGVMACPHWWRRLWCIAGDVVWQECSIYTGDQEPRNTWIQLPRLNRALSTSLNLQCDHSPSVNWHILPCFTKASRG